MDQGEAQRRLKDLQIPDGRITGIQVVKDASVDFAPGLTLQKVPDYARVNVECRPEPGSFIRIEVWLPLEDWNGDFVGTGNGGFAGALVPMVMAGPLSMGFAVANTDMGMSGGPDSGVGNPAVWKDFGYRATHLMTTVGKAVTETFYRTSIRYAYFSGGSTGGQQALSEAQRYPEDYDGILAGAPAYDRVNLHAGFVWDWLAVNQSENSKFTKEDAEKLTETFLEKYKKEGERREGDSFFYRPDQIHIDEDTLKELPFSSDQIQALRKLYQGPVNPHTGERIYEPLLTPGSESCDLGLAQRCDEKGFAHDFFYLFRWIFGVDFNFRTFDFDRHTMEACQKLGKYLDASDPDLRAFRDRGGKLILLHGTADPIIPCRSSIRYYEQAAEQMEDMDAFFRLFLVPGMGHISGGPGVQDILFGFPATPRDRFHQGLLALKAWVEEGEAPECLKGVRFLDGNILNGILPSAECEWERDIYPYHREETSAHQKSGKENEA